MRVIEMLECADAYETFPGSGELNWHNLPFSLLAEWSKAHPSVRSEEPVETMRERFTEWWRKHRKHSPLPDAVHSVHQCPVCHETVSAGHFICCTGKYTGMIGGKASGPKKKRGDSDYYRHLSYKRWHKKPE